MIGLRTVAPAAAALMLAFTSPVEAFAAAPAGIEAPISAEPGQAEQKAELECLATAIYHEARGEPEHGQLVVGRVILNRVASAYYPDTACKVVYQNVHLHNRCQFSFACDGVDRDIGEPKVWREIQGRAEWLINCLGDNDCQESKRDRDIWKSTHYHADYVHPFWADQILRVGQVGRHIFYYTATM
jgi:spore germination cell wall hydrolase CwlJ-like protein